MSLPNSAATLPVPRALWRTYLAFLGPMVVANILQALASTFNGIYVGQMLGTRALAAVSGMFPIVFFFVSLLIGIGAGASVLIGQAWGARDLEKVKTVAGSTLFLCALIGTAAAILGGLFASHALVALETPADVLQDAEAYARLVMLALPLLLVFVSSTQLLRGVGDSLNPLLASLLSTGAGMLFTPALIRGWVGLPQLGILAPAVAGIIANALALGFLILRLRRNRHALAPDLALWRALRPNMLVLVRVLRIGLPTGVQMVVISLAELAILSLVNRYGSGATAAYGAVNQVVNYVLFPAMSIAIAASILGSHAIGAGRVEQLSVILRTGLLLNVVIVGSLVGLGYWFSRQILGLFITQTPTLLVAEDLLHVMLWSMVLFGFQSIVGGIMRASGTVLVPVAISVASITLVELPCAYALSAHYGLKGVWIAYPIAFGTMLVLQISFYFGVWRHRKIERLT
ncbi:MATE family efflux transporter [Xylophilus sp. ASV27]|uniref:MATE family efflux transporter n=1 Tax=Xylophilus sp. ASV27 TaxID=2795129 RepID=UPI0018EDA41B|nr:MATE family efflux transporter [Xylophilus sp. ASV27]